MSIANARTTARADACHEVTIRSAPIGARLGLRPSTAAGQTRSPEEPPTMPVSRYIAPAASTADDQGSLPRPPDPANPPDPDTARISERLDALEASQADLETRIAACETRLGLSPPPASPPNDPPPAAATSVVGSIDERAAFRRMHEQRLANVAAAAARVRGHRPAAATTPAGRRGHQ